MSAEPRKRALRYLFAPVVDRLGYKFTPAEEDADFLLEQLANTEAETGVPYCPCQARGKDRAENMRIVCPCIPFHRAHYDFMRRCWCGLFVHKDVADPEGLPQISEEKFRALKGG